MTKLIETRRKLKSRLDSKQDISRAISALMGDGHGVVEVPNQPGYVYIRVGDGDLGQAFNNRCPLADNLAIYVGYDPVTDPDRRIFQVLSVRMADYASAGNPVVYPNVGAHHATHEYGGGDDVYVSWRRLMGLRVGRPVGFQIAIDNGVMFRAGAWLPIPAQTLDLTALKPVGFLSRYVLVGIDSAGVAIATAGTPVAGGLTIANCPIPAAGEIPLAAVRLYGTQTSIGDTPTAPDIVDLRFPQTNSTGTHDILSVSHGDTLTAAVVDGSIIIGNATPKWSSLSISIPAANVRNVLGIDNGELRPGWKTALDATNPTTIAPGAAAAPGTSLIFSHRDHTHGAPATWVATAHDLLSSIHGDTTAAAVIRGDIVTGQGASPKWARLAISVPAANVLNVLGVANGDTESAWKTVLDATNPTTISAGASSDPGTSLVFSHRDHTHGAPSTWAATAHNLLSATHSDASTSAAVAGSMIYASNAPTPLWTRLAGSGVENSVLQYSVATSSPFWSTGAFIHTTGTLQTNITAGKALTLTATNNAGLTVSGTGGITFSGAYTLTVPATGTAMLGTGAAHQVAVWSGTNTVVGLVAGTAAAVFQGGGALSDPYWSGGTLSLPTNTQLGVATANSIVTIDGKGGSSTLGLNSCNVTLSGGGASCTLTLPNAATSVTGGGTFAGTAGQTYTFPATGTVALLGTANVFTADQQINANLGIGAAPEAGYSLDVHGSFARVLKDGGSPFFVFDSYRASSNHGKFLGRAARGTLASPTIVNNGDYGFEIIAQGWDGAAFSNMAEIIFSVDGIPGLGDMPGNIIFETSPDGSATLTERMRVGNGGSILIGTTTDGMTAGGSLAIAQDLAHRGTKLGFYNTAPIAKQSGVAVTAAAIHAACVALGLFAA